eukprot:195826-Chlamydomonas_euryale.AAC.2
MRVGDTTTHPLQAAECSTLQSAACSGFGSGVGGVGGVAASVLAARMRRGGCAALCLRVRAIDGVRGVGCDRSKGELCAWASLHVGPIRDRFATSPQPRV